MFRPMRRAKRTISAEEVERELEKYLSAVQLYEIEIEHLTGKQVQEK